MSEAERQSPDETGVPCTAQVVLALSQAAAGSMVSTEGLLNRPARTIRTFPPSTPPAADNEGFSLTVNAILLITLWSITELRIPIEVRDKVPAPTISIIAEASFAYDMGICTLSELWDGAASARPALAITTRLL